MMNAQVVAEKMNHMQESFCAISNLKAKLHGFVLNNVPAVINDTSANESKENENELMVKKYAQENLILQRELEKLVDRLRKAEAYKQQNVCRDPNHPK